MCPRPATSGVTENARSAVSCRTASLKVTSIDASVMASPLPVVLLTWIV
jgi:hypothetical protein